MIQKKVLAAFRKEMDRAKQPGYVTEPDIADTYNELEEEMESEPQIMAEETQQKEKREDNFGEGLF